MGRNTLEQLTLFNLEDHEIKYDDSVETHKCRKCKKDKPLTEFHQQTVLRNNTSILATKCRSCEREDGRYLRELHKKAPPLPSDDYKCPCCDKTLEEINNHTVVVDRDTYKPVLRKYEKRWALDHNHVTGEIRGWICSPCNVSLGAFGDDPDRLRRAIKYLEGNNE